MNKTPLILLLTCAILPVAGAPKISPEELTFFEKRIRPVLVKHCYECHSVESGKQKGGLHLDSREGLLRGGDSGLAIVPGDSKKSLLLKGMSNHPDLEMPPHGKLSDDIIASFERWIEMGAPDPRDQPVSSAAKTSTSAATLWSLQPVKKIEPPDIGMADWSDSAIDRFIAARLVEKSINPSSHADSYTLIRRLYFDLIGLPPTPGQIESFVAAAKTDFGNAWKNLVNRLLGSTAYGERWGRHWLDVARYGESNGKSRDVLFPHAWRYRNWVIDAMNADMSYVRFVTEQIAGDLLPFESIEQRDSQRVATGLLAIGSKPLSGGNLTYDLIDDQIDVVTRGFLGLTASCARCHDHKFDPIPTADYYALAGIFNSTKTFYGGSTKRPKNEGEMAKVWMVLGDTEKQDIKGSADLQKRRGPLEKSIATLKKRVTSLKQSRNPNQKTIGATEDKLAAEEKRLERVEDLQGTIDFRFAMGVEEAGKPRDVAILVRGDKGEKGKVVRRGFLSCLKSPPDTGLPKDASGRLQLAKWIAHPENPLTARVAVNRIWYHLFGRGLVEGVDNFGVNGSRPSHSELLDWLAQRFMESGWSQKSLVREIVLSRTYRGASAFDSRSYKLDAENKLLWRANRRRLEVEALRDAFLVAGGRLIEERPETSVVARIGEGEVGRGINEKPLLEPFYHRGLYLPILRTAMSDIHKTFDFPDSGNIQGKRDVTNVPTQALFLMNNALVAEMAEAAGRRALATSGERDQQIRFAYLIHFNRPPADREMAGAKSFIRESMDRSESNQSESEREIEAMTTFCHALMASAEFRYLN